MGTEGKYDKQIDDFQKKGHEENIWSYKIRRWLQATNQEINDILKRQNIIGFIKKLRLNWLGHVERMAKDNNVQKINPCLKGQLEDLKHVGKMMFWKI